LSVNWCADSRNSGEAIGKGKAIALVFDSAMSAMHSKNVSDRIYAEGYSARKSHESVNKKITYLNFLKIHTYQDCRILTPQQIELLFIKML
jgi:hypothetical protein